MRTSLTRVSTSPRDQLIDELVDNLEKAFGQPQVGQDPEAQEVNIVTTDSDFVDVDLEVDFHSIDETGYL